MAGPNADNPHCSPKNTHPATLARLPRLMVLALFFQIFQAVATQAGSGADSGWTLGRALQHVRQANPDARSAALRIEKARAQLAEARAQLWPKVIAETSYTATDNPVNAFMMQLNQRQFGFGSDFNNPGTTDNWGSELRAEYPFYTGGARQAAISGARSGLEAASHEQSATLAQLELEVARAWFRIYQDREIVVAAKAALGNQRSNLKLVRDMREAATALQTAVLDLETKVAEAEADLAYASGSERISQAFLKTLLGLESGTDFEVAPSTLTRLKEPAQTSAGRAEMLALQQRVVQARAGIDQAKAGRLPVVSGFASGRHDEGFVDSGAGDSWMVGMMVRLNVWSGGETKAKIDAAEKDAALAEQQLRKQALAIELQVETARQNLETARKRIALADKGTKSAAESLQLTRQRFKEGLALSTQLIDSETALTGAQVRLAKARAGEQIALASLRFALGLPILAATQK